MLPNVHSLEVVDEDAGVGNVRVFHQKSTPGGTETGENHTLITNIGFFYTQIMLLRDFEDTSLPPESFIYALPHRLQHNWINLGMGCGL